MTSPLNEHPVIRELEEKILRLERANRSLAAELSGRSRFNETFHGGDPQPAGAGSILDLQHMADALRRSEADLQLALSAARMGQWNWNILTGEVVWSPQCLALYGLSADGPMTYERFLQAVHPDDRARVQAGLQKAVELRTSYDEEKRTVWSDGSIHWTASRGQVYCDSSGQPVRMTGVTFDITERKETELRVQHLNRVLEGWDVTRQLEAETELKRREERFRLLIENASDLITVVSAEGVIQFQSPSVVRMLGYQPEEMCGRSAFEFLHPDDAAKVGAAIQRALSDPSEPVSVEYRFRHRAGSWRILQSVGREIPGETVERFIVVNSRDITERIQLEEQFRQAQKMEAVGQLAGGVAHDFNNILTAMMMQAELAALVEELPDSARRYLLEIKSSVQRAASLTRQLLAFSRRQVMQPQRLDLNDSVTSLTRMLQRILGEDIRLQLNLHPRPLLLRVDPGMLDQVLMNLVVNSRDAMPEGGRLFIETMEKRLSDAEARLTPDASPGRHVCIRVSDTGCGISPDNLMRVFEPFFTTKDPGKGTGLGLAMVFGIVKQHGGWIQVESAVGRGTTFHIFLPADPDAALTETPEASRPKQRGGTERILLVEDESQVRILTRIVLERYGYTVLEAENGVEAIRVWEERTAPIQLLLTDMVMPEGVSGRQLASRLQERDPELRVIFTSGYSLEMAGRELELGPGQRFIQKPCTPRDLLEVVRECLDA